MPRVDRVREPSVFRFEYLDQALLVCTLFMHNLRDL